MPKNTAITSGVTYIPNGSANTFHCGDGYEFIELQAMTDCKFDAIDPADGFKIDNVDKLILPAGMTLKIKAVSFSIRSGSLLAYYSKIVDKRAAAQ